MATRRAFIAGLASLLVAPAIVRASSLMPIAPLRPTADETLLALLEAHLKRAEAELAKVYEDAIIYGRGPMLSWYAGPSGIFHPEKLVTKAFAWETINVPAGAYLDGR
jgi:hypothetical protein